MMIPNMSLFNRKNKKVHYPTQKDLMQIGHHTRPELVELFWIMPNYKLYKEFSADPMEHKSIGKDHSFFEQKNTNLKKAKFRGRIDHKYREISIFPSDFRENKHYDKEIEKIKTKFKKAYKNYSLWSWSLKYEELTILESTDEDEYNSPRRKHKSGDINVTNYFWHAKYGFWHVNKNSSHTEYVRNNKEKFFLNDDDLKTVSFKKGNPIKTDDSKKSSYDFDIGIIKTVLSLGFVRITVSQNSKELNIHAHDESVSAKCIGECIKYFKKVKEVYVDLESPKNAKNRSFHLNSRAAARIFAQSKHVPSSLQQMRLSESIELTHYVFKSHMKATAFSNALKDLKLVLNVVIKDTTVSFKTPKKEDTLEIIDSLADDYKGMLEEGSILDSIETLLYLNEKYINIFGHDLEKTDAAKIWMLHENLNEENKEVLMCNLRKGNFSEIIDFVAKLDKKQLLGENNNE